MSITLEQILLDAKRLSNRLKEHDSAADHLLSQTQTVYKQIDAMKQYTEDLNELSESSGRPHAALVAEIQKENKVLRALQMENAELRAALEDHQNAIELIMSKYRQQVTKLMHGRSSDIAKEILELYRKEYAQVIDNQNSKINEMASVITYAVELDDDKHIREIYNQKDEEISRLTVENQGLRELLSISRKCGTSKPQTVEPKQEPTEAIEETKKMGLRELLSISTKCGSSKPQTVEPKQDPTEAVEETPAETTAVPNSTKEEADDDDSPDLDVSCDFNTDPSKYMKTIKKDTKDPNIRNFKQKKLKGLFEKEADDDDDIW